jgi:hypothetical protein
MGSPSEERSKGFDKTLLKQTILRERRRLKRKPVKQGHGGA